MLTRIKRYFTDFWTNHAAQVRDSANSTLFVVLLSAALTVFLAFADGAGKNITLVTLLASSLKNISQQAFDTVNFVQSGVTLPHRDGEKVYLIDLDDQAVQQVAAQQAQKRHCEFKDASKCQANQMLYFNREALASILNNLSRFDEKPEAVFIDLDFSYPDPYSDSRALISALQKVPFPVFLPYQKGRENQDAFVLDGRIQHIRDFPNLCFVNHDLLLDEGDFKIRQLAGPKAGYPSVAEALYQVSRGNQVKAGQHTCNKTGQQAASTPIEISALVYKKLDRNAELQYWDSLEIRKAAEILQHPTDQHLYEPGLVMIGRTDRDNGDNYYTPISPFVKVPTSGVEVHLTSLMNLLNYNHFGKAVSGIYILIFAAITLFILQLAATLLVDSTLKLKNLLGDFLEIVLVWLLLLIPAAAIMHYQGYFLDYTLPLVALYLLRTFMKLHNPETAAPTSADSTSDGTSTSDSTSVSTSGSPENSGSSSTEEVQT
ncbi:CHASE2 domain-containing protein [Deinococcus roseus]|uniref:CHASE2 domain-containing protein n=1 Tax=Deinococcus roseus TaxID=392414 RepID=UPI00166CD8E3|nr:CHASE2 domain-containing protein [Deinococcus roseus]